MVAPKVIEETTRMAKMLGIKKGLKNAAITTGVTAGGIGGGAYLLNLLRGKGNSSNQ